MPSQLMNSHTDKLFRRLCQAHCEIELFRVKNMYDCFSYIYHFNLPFAFSKLELLFYNVNLLKKGLKKYPYFKRVDLRDYSFFSFLLSAFYYDIYILESC